MAIRQLDSCKQRNIKKLSQTCLVPLRLACRILCRRTPQWSQRRYKRNKSASNKNKNLQQKREQKEEKLPGKNKVYIEITNNKKEARQKAGHMFHGAVRQARFKNLKIEKKLALLPNHPFPPRCSHNSLCCASSCYSSFSSAKKCIKFGTKVTCWICLSQRVDDVTKEGVAKGRMGWHITRCVPIRTGRCGSKVEVANWLWKLLASLFAGIFFGY